MKKEYVNTDFSAIDISEIERPLWKVVDGKTGLRTDYAIAAADTCSGIVAVCPCGAPGTINACSTFGITVLFGIPYSKTICVPKIKLDWKNRIVYVNMLEDNQLGDVGADKSEPVVVKKVRKVITKPAKV